MSAPKSLRVLLSGWRPAGERTPPGGEAGALAAAWPDAVGADVARRTRTSTFRDGAITVITPSSAWSHQLTFLAPTIIERLHALCPGVAVRRLRFVVATGRSRTLLAGARAANAAPPSRARGGRQTRPQAAGTTDAGTADAEGLDASASSGDDLATVLARLRADQQRLDAKRSREGWVRCSVCGCWSRTQRCEPCIQEAQRNSDARIASALAGAPWLRWSELVAHLPEADQHSFARVRRALLARWQQQLFNARARLRRRELDASDRVIAWSYAMLFTQHRQEGVSDAVLVNVLGRDWADALRSGPSASAVRSTTRAASARKAQRPTHEK